MKIRYKDKTVFEATIWEIVFWIIFIAGMIRLFKFIAG